MPTKLNEIITPPVCIGALTAVFFVCMSQIGADKIEQKTEIPQNPSYATCQFHLSCDTGK